MREAAPRIARHSKGSTITRRFPREQRDSPATREKRPHVTKKPHPVPGPSPPANRQSATVLGHPKIEATVPAEKSLRVSPRSAIERTEVAASLLNNRQCQASLTIDATPRVMKYTCSIGSKGACITHLRKRKLHGLEVRTDS